MMLATANNVHVNCYCDNILAKERRPKLKNSQSRTAEFVAKCGFA